MSARDFGPKPVAKWLSVEQLRVDETYQRSIETRRSQSLIGRVTETFYWPLFGAVIVAIDEGEHWVIDGQHRVEAARRIGIDKVLCIVVVVGSKAEAARAFVGANRDRVAPTPYALHHALVAAGDPDAVAINDVCRRAGVEIPRYPIPLQSLKPNQTLTIGAIRSSISRLGGGATVSALKTLREAFPEPGALRAHLITGVAAVFAARAQLPRQLLQDLLTAKGFKALEGEILAEALGSKDKRAAIAERIIERLLPPEFRRRGTVQKKTAASVSASKRHVGNAILPAATGTKPSAASKRAEDQRQIEEHIRRKGVTKVPVAAVAPTTAVFKSQHQDPFERESTLAKHRNRRGRLRSAQNNALRHRKAKT